MCGDIWNLWAVACYVLVGLCIGFGWYVGNKLASLIIK